MAKKRTAKTAPSAFPVEMMSLDDITPYIRNPRKNENSVEKVRASLLEFGWRQPLVVDKDRVIIVGDTRYRAAKLLGEKFHMAPVHVADNLTDAQIKAYRIMDNRSHEEALWDRELLALEMEDLQELEFDLALTGFNADEIDGFLLADFPEEPLNNAAIPEKQFSIMVTCKSEGEQKEIYELLQGKGIDAKLMVL